MANPREKTELEYYQEYLEISQMLVVAIVQGQPPDSLASKQLTANLTAILAQIARRFNVFLPQSPEDKTPAGKIHFKDWLRAMSTRDKN